MRLRPPRVLPLLAYSLAAALGCAGAGSATGTGGVTAGSAGKGGSSSSGAAGTSSSGSAGTSSSGNAGTSGDAGTTGSGGSVGPGAGGMSGAVGAAGSGAGGMSAGQAGTTATAGTTGAAGTTTSGSAGTTGSGGTGGICQMAQLIYEPKIPTVYLLVDRSGSMFHCLTGNTGNAVCDVPANTAWSNLKEAVRTVVGQLDMQVRFGFTTVWGTDPSQSGGMCPSIQGMLTDSVGPDVDNATKIMQKYDALPFPPNSTQQGVKFESPASESIQAVTAALTAFTAPGDKYILFITDGQPDYCDDSNSLCAPDSVIARIQAAKTANISTIVLGLQTTLFDLPAGILDAYATAGNGEPTVAPLRSGSTDANAFYDQCNSIAGWKADLTALGKTNARGTTLGTYSTTAGPSKAYKPSASDQTMLASQLTMALAGVKSCSFDLTDVGGKSIKVETTKLNQAHVFIEGAEVPLSTTNGWTVDTAAPTVLVFSGTACNTWKMPNSKKIDLQFPCGTIIFE